MVVVSADYGARSYLGAWITGGVGSPVATARLMLMLPEVTLVVFALLLNFPWEVLQAPLFEGMAAAPHSTVVGACLQATLGML